MPGNVAFSAMAGPPTRHIAQGCEAHFLPSFCPSNSHWGTTHALQRACESAPASCQHPRERPTQHMSGGQHCVACHCAVAHAPNAPRRTPARACARAPASLARPAALQLQLFTRTRWSLLELSRAPPRVHAATCFPVEARCHVAAAAAAKHLQHAGGWLRSEWSSSRHRLRSNAACTA